MREDKLLKLTSVLEYVQISKTKLYDLMALGEFPKPMKLGGNTLWHLSDIQKYIEDFKSKKAS